VASRAAVVDGDDLVRPVERVSTGRRRSREQREDGLLVVHRDDDDNATSGSAMFVLSSQGV
jgi:hypothetical protein